MSEIPDIRTGITILQSVRHEFDPQRRIAFLNRLADVINHKEKSELLNVDYDKEHPFNPDPVVKLERDFKTAKERMSSTTKPGFAKREIDRLTNIEKEIRFHFSGQEKVFESEIYCALDDYVVFLQEYTSTKQIQKLRCSLSDNQLKEIHSLLVKNKMLEDPELDLWFYWFNRKHLEKAKRLKWKKSPQLLSNVIQRICKTLQKGAVVSTFGIKVPNSRPERHTLHKDLYASLDRIVQN